MDIRKSDTIILYDRVNVFSSPRGFLTFKWFGHKDVKILNGGFPRYKQLKGETEKDDTFNVEKINEYRKNNLPIKEDDFNYALESNRIYNLEKVYENKNNAFLIDARSEERFEGKVPEPRKSLRVGHIKGALNLSFKHLINENGRYKNNEEIESLFKKIGVEGDKDIIGYCGSGLTACIVLLSLCLIGKEKNLRLYDGSWFDYGNIPEEELKKLEEKYQK